MTVLQVVLLLIGIVCLIGSFFITERLSASDLADVKKLSEDEIRTMIAAQLKDASVSIDDRIEEKCDDVITKIENSGAKEVNEKILSIGEYSDTVLNSMNKSHDEIIFLYDMLNDKQERVTELTKELGQMESQVRALVEELTEKLAQQEIALPDVSLSDGSSAEMSDVDDASQKDPSLREALGHKIEVTQTEQGSGEEDTSSKEEIIRLYQEGKSEVEIAKELGRGLGEVKLVLGLFGEEHAS